MGGKEGRKRGWRGGRWGRRGEEGYYSVQMLFTSLWNQYTQQYVYFSPCVQRERQKDREKLRKKKESDLPGAVMQMNKYATNEAFSKL